MAGENSSLQTHPNKATILRKLAEMAERLNLSSNQAILVYAGCNGWLNYEYTAIALNALQKVAGANKISLYDEKPFIAQLIERGIIQADEAAIFGFRVTKKEQDNGGKKELGEGGNSGANGNGRKAAIATGRKAERRA